MEIQLQHLSKSYQNKTVLVDLNHCFASGQIHGLMGDNGAGKSTLLKMIAGLDLEYEGRILYDGHPLQKKDSKRMTMVFQTPQMLKKTVYENIAYPLKLRRFARQEIQNRVEKAMAQLQITNLSKQYAHKLSGGESQKVALARALVFEPELVLLDEPMSGIDSKSLQLLEDVLVDYVRRKRATVIMITHSAFQAASICQSIYQVGSETLESGED